MNIPNEVRLIPYGTTHLTPEESILIVASLIAMAARLTDDTAAATLRTLASRILTQVEDTIA